MLVSHPGDIKSTPSHFMLLKIEISTDLMGHLACKQTELRLVSNLSNVAATLSVCASTPLPPLLTHYSLLVGGFSNGEG